MFDSLRGMNGNRRFVVLGIAAVLVVLAIVLGRFATTPEYVTLFHDADLAEVGNITDHLQKASIPFKLGLGGSEVQVPAADAARARVLLAKDGLPSAGRPGLELFDKPSWGMTDFTQHVTYRRALEGELARTISTLRGVKSAQVHLALPEANALRRLEQPAEAAVVLSLQGGASLTGDQVRGIAQMVSSSVERLPVDRVAVLDDSGRLLSSAGGGDDQLALTTKQLDLQQSIEKHLQAKIQPLMTAVVGENAAKVQVSARLNFDQVERSIEAYDSNGQVLSNEQRSEGGVDKETGTTTPTVVNNTFLNSRRLEKIVGELGNISRLSVSVMVDEHAFGSADVAETRRRQLEQVVKTAVGFDSTRGDQLAVSMVPFSAPPGADVAKVKDEPMVKPSITELASRFAIPAVALLAVVAAFVLGLKALKPSKSTATLALESSETISGSIPPGYPDHSQLRQRATTESLQAPETAARVVRGWLTETA